METPQVNSELAIQQAQFALTPVGQSIKQFEMVQRVAKMYSESNIIPTTYQGKLGNCAIAIDMAMRMNINPVMVMHNLYIVHGNPSFSAKFLIATINASGRFSPLRFEFTGEHGTDDWGCMAYAYEVSDRERKSALVGDRITIGMAKAEGWATKNGSKWLTMPDQMLRYRAAAFWQRVFCPEISMGFMTTEEAHDIEEVDYEEVRSPKASIAQAAAKAQASQPVQGDGINTPLTARADDDGDTAQ